MEPGPALPSDGPWPRTCETKPKPRQSGLQRLECREGPFAARPVPVARRRFGAWAYALRLRIAWDQRGEGPEGPEGRRPKRWRGRAEDRSSELRRASEFSVSPRVRPASRCPVCRDGSHRRARLQPCGHLFCRPCGKRLLGRACLRCGVICRQAEQPERERESPDERKRERLSDVSPIFLAVQVEDCQFQAPTCGDAADAADAETLVWGATDGAYCLRPSVQPSPSVRLKAKTKAPQWP